MFTHLISTRDLAAHFDDPNWVIIDCRFELAKPDWGFEEYQSGHIPGALYAHLDRDLASPVTPQTGRHPLPDLSEWMDRLSTWGITPGSQVVVYDTSGGSYAVRLWFLLRYIGHEAAAVLDGGFSAWRAANLPTKIGVETRPRSKYPMPEKVHSEWIATADQVDEIRTNPDWILIDARSPERFRGENETIDSVAGHIPGAVNRFYGLNLTPDGTFKSPQALAQEFRLLLGGKPASKAVVYCGSGVTSCHHLVALASAGMEGARVFIGSWSEWIRDSDHPIATGE